MPTLIGYSSECRPIKYPPPQAPISTDLLTSLSLTSTNHAENQPVHLRLPDGAEARKQHVEKNVNEFAGLLGHACPAGVYEYVDVPEGEKSDRVEDASYGGKKLVINSQVRGDSISIEHFTEFILQRTAYTASYAISKFLPKILPGLYRKAEVARSTVSEGLLRR